MTVAIKNSPAHAPGQGVANAMHHSQKWVKSAAVAYDDTSPINVFEVPGNMLVVGGFVEVTAAFDPAGTSAAATVNVTVPNATGTETVWDAGLVGLASTGLKPFSAFAQTPASGGYVIATYAAGTTTSGGFNVWLAYVDRVDEF